MFTGFSDATIDFLWELRFHNERPWFLEHKQVFVDTLDRPMKALAADVTAALEQAYPQRKWYLHVARIYRDARRLHGSRTVQGEPLVYAALRQQPAGRRSRRFTLRSPRTTTATAWAATGQRQTRWRASAVRSTQTPCR